jgi:hypothetical protein
MAIRHKRTTTTGYSWQSGDTVEGQIGLNLTDGTLHFKKSNGTYVALSGGGLTDIVQDTTPQLGGQLDVQTYKITTSVADGNVEINPNGSGNVILSADTVQVGDDNATATITTNGTGNLILNTNNGSSSGSITIANGANTNITLAPQGTGDIILSADTVQVGDNNAAATITTNGTGNLILNTNNGTNSGTITLAQGTNANITIAPNGTGDLILDTDTVTIGGGESIVTINTSSGSDLLLWTNNGTDSGLIRLFDSANTNIEITPNGTGQTIIKNLEYNENVFSLGTTSGTITPNAANGNIQTITLNGNLTFNAFTSPVSGQTITLIISTGGTSRTLTSTMLFAGGSKTLSTTNTVDILTVSYIGTTYYATLSKGYA